MYTKKLKHLLLLLASLLASCSESILKPEYTDTPIDNYNYLWSEFDKKYALFGHNGIDWKHRYNTHIEHINNSLTDEQLWYEMTELLSVLNDNHVYLLRPEREVYTSGTLYKRPAFWDGKFLEYDKEIRQFYSCVMNNYLSEFVIPVSDTSIVYGTINNKSQSNDTIGYIFIRVATEEIRNVFSQAISSLKTSKGIIIDFRFHTGGDDYIAK